MNKSEIEVRFTDGKAEKGLEILVPSGMSHTELNKIRLGELLSKFRPSGCGACLSGQPFKIRERFEKVILVDLHAEKLGV